MARRPGPTAADSPPARTFGERLRFHAVRWGLLLPLAAVVYVTFPAPTTRGAPALGVGQSADRDVIAPLAFTVVKTPEEYTREGDALARSVRPVYQFSSTAYDSAMTSLQLFFEALAPIKGEAARVWAVGIGDRVRLEDDEAAWLADPAHRRGMAEALTALVGGALARGVADAGVMRNEPSARIAVRRGDGERIVARDSVLTFAELVERADRESQRWRQPAAQRAFRRLALAFYQPTIIADPVATLARREQARRSVDSVKYAVPAGERIVAAHETVTPEIHEKLEVLQAELRQHHTGRLVARSVAGAMLFDMIILAPFWLLLRLYRPDTWDDLRQMTFFAVLFGVVVALSAGLVSLFHDRPELLPIPLAAMLVAILFDARLGVMAGATLAILLGGQWGLRDTNVLFFGLVGGVAGAVGIRAMRRRHVLYATIGLVTGAYLLGSGALALVLGWSLEDLAASALAGAIGALGCGALAMLLLPMAESGTRITTHLTLLELSDFRRPLLRRLALEAPGTWAHSISMANLCEAACNAIGADGLLARVGCYYHDIGKLSRPQYFIENQRPGANPHDLLPPLESARIIRQHVIDGIALATDAKLPPAVRDFIPEHHGTTEIRYFLHRARRPGVVIDPADFRYPGPRPRSAETAITMLADSAEAAVRVLDDPTPEAVRDAIDQLVAQRLASGQLAEAPLTLRDLDRVKLEFARVLSGIHHNRVEYPRASGAFPGSMDAVRPA